MSTAEQTRVPTAVADLAAALAACETDEARDALRGALLDQEGEARSGRLWKQARDKVSRDARKAEAGVPTDRPQGRPRQYADPKTSLRLADGQKGRLDAVVAARKAAGNEKASITEEVQAAIEKYLRAAERELGIKSR